MAQTSTTVGIADLLKHAAWARRVATYVAASSADAQDAVQDAWLAALEHPPNPASPARPWLGAVVRNAVRARFRSTSRRQQREQQITSSEPTLPSTESLLATAQMQQQLGEAVLRLDEPYRTTVLLRFYQELSSAEIARQLSIPEGTVRWRLKTALAQLRTQLATPQHHDLKHWVAGFAPGVPAPAVPTTAAAALLKGSLIMKISLAIVVTAAIVVAIIVSSRSSSSSSPGSASTTAPTKPFAAPPPPLVQAAVPAALTRPRLTPAERVTRMQALAAVRSEPRAPSPNPLPARGTAPPHLDDEIDQAYVRERIAELRPYLIECYETMLASAPNSQGNITVRFTIVGEPEVGGLVGESEIDDVASTIKDPEFRQCVQESMFAANFKAPANGGTVEVRYPFEFNTSP